jgi:hypothetical protein
LTVEPCAQCFLNKKIRTRNFKAAGWHCTRRRRRALPTRAPISLRFASGKESYKFSSESFARFSTCAWLYWGRRPSFKLFVSICQDRESKCS